MHTNQLSRSQFEATLATPMENVTLTAGPTADIWPYVAQLVTDGLVLPLVYENRLVEKVYRNRADAIDQVLLPTPRKNEFVVILVKATAHEIYGHYLLDMNE